MSSTAKSWIRIIVITALGATADVITDGHLSVAWEWVIDFCFILAAVILLVDECVGRVAMAIRKAVDNRPETTRKAGNKRPESEHKNRHLRSGAL